MENPDRNETLVLKKTENPTLGDRFGNAYLSALKWGLGTGGALLFAEWWDKYILSPIAKNFGEAFNFNEATRKKWLEYKPATADNYQTVRWIAVGVAAIAGIYSFFFKKKETETTLSSKPSSALSGLSDFLAKEQARRSSPDFTKKILEERQSQPETTIQK